LRVQHGRVRGESKGYSEEDQNCSKESQKGYSQRWEEGLSCVQEWLGKDKAKHQGSQREEKENRIFRRSSPLMIVLHLCSYSGEVKVVSSPLK